MENCYHSAKQKILLLPGNDDKKPEGGKVISLNPLISPAFIQTHTKLISSKAVGHKTGKFNLLDLFCEGILMQKTENGKSIIDIEVERLWEVDLFVILHCCNATGGCLLLSILNSCEEQHVFLELVQKLSGSVPKAVLITHFRVGDFCPSFSVLFSAFFNFLAKISTDMSLNQQVRTWKS